MTKRSLVLTLSVTLLLIGVSFLLLPGCDSSETSSMSTEDDSALFQEDYFKYAVDMLQRLNESSGGAMRQQIVDHLNQWAPSQKPPKNWALDPILAELPKDLQPQKLDDLHFTTADGFELQQAIWMRDLSAWVCEDVHDPVEQGTKLFDWIVRNIQLRQTPDDGYGSIPKQPWEALFFGRGIAVERAWVFALAAKQLALDAVILAVPLKDDPEKLVPWAIGLVDGKELYLFEPALGLPIPAKNGISFENNQLIVKPATLSEVLANPTILESLDINKTLRYPFTIEQIKQSVAMIPTSAASLSARFALIESRMTGDQRVVLTAHPSAFAKELQEVKGLAPDRIRLWPRPFVVDEKRAKLGPKEEATLAVAMRPFTIGQESLLWRGRVSHIMGKLTGKQGASLYYQKARIPERTLSEYEQQFSSDSSISKKEVAQAMRAFYKAKEDATYWLGLVNYSIDDEQATLDYLKKIIQPPIYYRPNMPTLPKPRWLIGACYNLGRSYERAGNLNLAVKSYLALKNAPTTYGNLVRVSWLNPALDQPILFEEPEATPPEKAPEKEEKAAEKKGNEE
jgi:hypothetical protein